MTLIEQIRLAWVETPALTGHDWANLAATAGLVVLLARNLL